MRYFLSILIAATLWAQSIPGGSVAGFVTEATTGTPMEGASVRATSSRGYSEYARTDSQGHYVLSKLPLGTLYVSASRSNSHRTFPPGIKVDLAARGGATANFILQPASAITGKIFDGETKAPVSGCHVTALRKIAHSGISGFITSPPDGEADADPDTGRFEIRDLDIGEYVLAVGPGEKGKNRKLHCETPTFYGSPTNRNNAATIAITSPGAISINIVLEKIPTYSISGAVSVPKDAASSYLRITVTDLNPDGPGNGRVILLNKPGDFRIENLPNGDYAIAVADWRPPPIVLGQTSQLDNSGDHLWHFAYDGVLRIRDADIEGLEITLQPVQAVTVRGIIRTDDGINPSLKLQMALESAGQHEGIHSALTAASEPLEVTVMPGEYWPVLRPVPTGYGVTEILAGNEDVTTVPLRAEERSKSLTFVLSSRLGALRGKARNSDLVILFREPVIPGVDVMPLMSVPDYEGVFQLKNVPPGAYRIVALDSADHLALLDRSFLRRLAAAATVTVEVKAGELAEADLNP